MHEQTSSHWTALTLLLGLTVLNARPPLVCGFAISGRSVAWLLRIQFSIGSARYVSREPGSKAAAGRKIPTLETSIEWESTRGRSTAAKPIFYTLEDASMKKRFPRISDSVRPSGNSAAGPPRAKRRSLRELKNSAVCSKEAMRRCRRWAKPFR